MTARDARLPGGCGAGAQNCLKGSLFYIKRAEAQQSQSINQNAKPAMPKGSLRTKQHTTPADEQKSHNPMPANHMDTPRTGEPLRPHKTLQHRVEARCNGVHTKRANQTGALN